MSNDTQKKNGAIVDKKATYKNIIKWLLIFALLGFAYYNYQDFFNDAIDNIKHTSVVRLLLCFICGNMFFIAEGYIISRMTATGNKRLSFFQGISCTYMCAFYRLTTLGSGNGIAQLYYYNTKGIPVAEATGMAISQYTFQKITIGIMGVVSFILLTIFADHSLLKYSNFMLAGVVVISLICIFLFLITVSKTISDFVMKLGRKIVKKESKLYAKLDQAQVAIDSLQRQGRLIWKDKKLFLTIVLLDVFKFCCWYIIPGILFVGIFDTSILICLPLMAVCNMIGCVMIAPSGVGTLDFVFTTFFTTIIPLDEAVGAAIIIYRFFTWVVPFLIGLIPAIFLKKENVPTGGEDA